MTTAVAAPVRAPAQRLALALLSERRYEAARSAFWSLVDADVSSEVLRSWDCLDGCHSDEHSARELFTRALRTAPESSTEAAAWNTWALMEQRRGHISAAKKCFLNGLQIDPSRAPLIQAFALFEAKYSNKRKA
ncbi:TPR repeat containing protein [Gracilaria domingensis]|nr:TPR repeat containing protein [Gracilaria domingensis]